VVYLPALPLLISGNYDFEGKYNFAHYDLLRFRRVSIRRAAHPGTARFSVSPLDLMGVPDVPLLLRGWAEERRRLRIVARLGLVDFSALCRISSVAEDSFALVIGSDLRDVIGFKLEGWIFAFTDAPPKDNEMFGETIESAILGIREGLSLFIFLLVG
jgi:hypothetical protein